MTMSLMYWRAQNWTACFRYTQNWEISMLTLLSNGKGDMAGKAERSYQKCLPVREKKVDI